MLPTREIAGARVVTSAFGLGCAGLFRIPQRSARKLVLDAAFDAGIRHFDVAPMYGLGLAESELASLLHHHRAEVTVTTKFGIQPTFVGKGIGRVQRPIRAYLAKRPAVNEELKEAGQGPGSGSLGRLIYASPGYHRRSAQLGLERSLSELGTDYIDVFLLHDPTWDLVAESASDLADYLNEQCRMGRIRAWGVSGESFQLASIMRSFGHASDGAWITYGALARSLPLLRRFLAQSPSASLAWSERLGIDLAEEPGLPKMLLSAALWRNTAGPVLFSTTRPERAQIAAAAAAQSVGLSQSKLTVLSEFAAAASRARTEMAEAS